nr:hypothetical protein [Aestuariivita sp.]
MITVRGVNSALAQMNRPLARRAFDFTGAEIRQDPRAQRILAGRVRQAQRIAVRHKLGHVPIPTVKGLGIHGGGGGGFDTHTR